MTGRPEFDRRADVTSSPTVVRRIDHIGLVVANLEPVVQYYTEKLGMERDGEAIELEGRATTVQFLTAGDDRVELLSPTDLGGPLGRFLAKRGEGLHHVCYEVGDIHASVKSLAGAGVRLIDEVPWRSPHGWVAYIHPAAAHGCAIELREHYR